MKLRSNKSVSGKNQENRSIEQEESIVFIDDETDISSDEVYVPQTSRKRKYKPSPEKRSKLFDKKDKSSNGEPIVFIDDETDISSDEVDVPQTSRKRKYKPSPEKRSNFFDKKGKSSDGVGTSGASRNNVGLIKRKNGNVGVKIHDRIRKKDLWLGTYGSAEEASKVYWAKKEELEKEFEVLAKDIVTVEETKKTSKFVGVSRRASGKFAAHIRDPIRKKKLYLGAFDIEEDASKAYLAKKEELMKEVKEGKTGARWYLGKREFRKPESLIIRKRRNFGGETRNRTKVCEDPCSDVQESSMESDDFDSSSSGESESSDEVISEEENSDVQESSMEIDDFDSSSSGESESSDEGISEKENEDEAPCLVDDQLSQSGERIFEEENEDEAPCLEDDQLSSRKFDHSDSLDGENATTRDGTFESPVIKEENGEPCSDNQEHVDEEINNVVTSERESVSMAPIASKQDLPIQKNGVKDELINVDHNVQSPVNPGNCSNANVLLRTNSGTPMMDSNGLLLGEWSWIDECGLSITP